MLTYLVYLNNKNAEPCMDQLFGGKLPRGATELRDILNKDRKEWISAESMKTRSNIIKIMESIAGRQRIGLRPHVGSLNHNLSDTTDGVRVEHRTDCFLSVLKRSSALC